MPRSRTRLLLILAWLLFWGLMVSTAVQDFIHDGGREYWKPVLWETSSALTCTLLLLAQRRMTRQHDALISSPPRWFARQLAWLPTYWLLFTPVAFGMRHAVYAFNGQAYTHTPWPETFLYENVKITVFFALFTGIVFGLLSFHAMLEERLRAAQAQASLREAQLLRLGQQMQPHFLFNALNTISSLMYSDVQRADAMLVQLSDVLRATLDVGERHLVPLETELRILRGYAALMAERFSDRVSIGWHIDESLLDCDVPVMSMQPLLENIFKHTVEKRRQPTAIRISAQRHGDALVLRLEDDAGALPAGGASPGIGVRNLRERLDALYAGRAAFALTALSPAGVRAEVRLPCAS